MLKTESDGGRRSLCAELGERVATCSGGVDRIGRNLLMLGVVRVTEHAKMREHKARAYF